MRSVSLMIGPDKNKLFPNEDVKSVAYIKNLPKRPNIEIGDYTYYSTPNGSPEDFYQQIEHHYEFWEINSLSENSAQLLKGSHLL